MSRIRKLLFLIAAEGHARLVRYLPGEGRFATAWMSGETCADPQGDLIHEIIRQAGREIAVNHLEGLFIVAPASELEELRERLERGLIVVGGVDEDGIDQSDTALARTLTQALQAPSPER